MTVPSQHPYYSTGNGSMEDLFPPVHILPPLGLERTLRKRVRDSPAETLLPPPEALTPSNITKAVLQTAATKAAKTTPRLVLPSWHMPWTPQNRPKRSLYRGIIEDAWIYRKECPLLQRLLSIERDSVYGFVIRMPAIVDEFLVYMLGATDVSTYTKDEVISLPWPANVTAPPPPDVKRAQIWASWSEAAPRGTLPYIVWDMLPSRVFDHGLADEWDHSNRQHQQQK